jgi:hypothetical protein
MSKSGQLAHALQNGIGAHDPLGLSERMPAAADDVGRRSA